MNMKGVSAVIATILMLLITIALAGTAYLYITGVFTAKTSVVLNIDGTSSTCTLGALNIVVNNGGTGVATFSTTPIVVADPSGTAMTCGAITKTDPSGTATTTINSGSYSTVTCTRPTGTKAGTYTVTIYAGAATVNGPIYCAAAS